MASTRKQTIKDEQVFYEIRVSRGRGKSYLFTRWYPSEGWSQKAIDRALAKEMADFERRCHEGEVISRAEKKESDLQQKREAAKIQTLQKYGEEMFMPTKALTMSENGRCAYQGNLNHWIYPALGALGELKMPDITPANISALLPCPCSPKARPMPPALRSMPFAQPVQNGIHERCGHSQSHG